MVCVARVAAPNSELNMHIVDVKSGSIYVIYTQVAYILSP